MCWWSLANSKSPDWRQASIRYSSEDDLVPEWRKRSGSTQKAILISLISRTISGKCGFDDRRTIPHEEWNSFPMRYSPAKQPIAPTTEYTVPTTRHVWRIDSWCIPESWLLTIRFLMKSQQGGATGSGKMAAVLPTHSRVTSLPSRSRTNPLVPKFVSSPTRDSASRYCTESRLTTSSLTGTDSSIYSGVESEIFGSELFG